MVTRRLLLGALALTPFAVSNASAQSATGEALDDFARYVDAAASILSELALGIRNADARNIRGPDAQRALEELQAGLRNQAVSNARVIDELSDYRAYAQQASVEPSVRARMWAEALQQVSDTAAVVRRVTAIVDESAVLSRVLTDDRQLALRDTLAMREAILRRLTALPPPASQYDLDRLDRFIARYNDLISALRQIRVALNRALRE